LQDFAGDVEVQQDPLDHRRAVPVLHTDKECTCPAEDPGEEGKKRKAEEILQRRAETEKKNAEIRK
jgi:hypothetical protein